MRLSQYESDRWLEEALKWDVQAAQADNAKELALCQSKAAACRLQAAKLAGGDGKDRP